jgi:hypothetical protein
MNRSLLLSLGLAFFLFPSHARATESLNLDFEDTADPRKIDRLDCSGTEAAVVAAEGRGRCLQLRNSSPSSQCGLSLKGSIRLEKNLVLSFDHCEEVEAGFEGAYLGIGFYVDGKQYSWTKDDFTGKWQHVDVAFADLAGSAGKRLELGMVFSRISIYARVKEKTKEKGATKARMTLRIDNLRLHTDPLPSKLSPVVRESYSNPPVFIWKPAGTSPRRLQYSLDRTFPAAASTTVEATWDFFTPSAPIEPGTWYWRTQTAGELTDRWSEIQTVVVAPDAHRFVTAPIPVETLTKTPRPWLLPLAKVDQPEVTAKRKAELVKQAKKIFQRGVPEHPGPHVPGDPRWPTWIEWYGKVAGGITGNTGRRLQTIAQYAMLTRDPEVIEWTRQLALEACKWDPEGGSAMKLGDIGAQHLLRGLNWCYDVCRDTLSPADRETLCKIIIQRAGQFWARLYPYRSNDAQNHTWLQTLALGEAGIVLLGDRPEAAQWAEYARQLYVGRYLCCLGQQGDNNEGISYWSYGLGFIIEYSDLLKAVCGIDLFKHPWLNQTARFPMYCAPPDAWAVSFADTGMPNHGTRGPAMTDHVRQLALRTRDPYALWYSSKTKEPVDGLAPREPTDLPASIHYRSIGVTIFNTSLVNGKEGATVAMHSGRFWAGHQHPDQNHFVIHAYGEKLAIDGGYYDWYGSPHFKAYSMTTLAHNTLLVDGQGQAACTPGADGRTTAYFDSPGYGYVVGDAANPLIYQGKLKQFDRRLLFIKPGFVVVHDLVAAADKAARFDWMLHAIVPIETDAAARSFRIPCTNAALQGRFFLPADAAMEVKTGFPVEPVNRYSRDPVPKDKYFPEWTLFARPPREASETEFFAAMQIQRLGEHAEPSAEMTQLDGSGARAVRLRLGDHTHLVVFRSPHVEGMMIQAEGLSTDGDVAAVELDAAGKVVRAMAIHATRVVYREKPLFTGRQPTDWSIPAK